MGKFKQILSAFLAVGMLTFSAPMSIFAVEDVTPPAPTGTPVTASGNAYSIMPLAADTCPFTITGGTVSNTDYTWDATNSVLTINNDTEFTISMAEGVTGPVTARIAAKGTTVDDSTVTTYNALNLTLAGVNITAPENYDALGGGAIKITLQGNNTLKGGSNSGNGIIANTLTINGPGTLQAQGTSGKHGIHIAQSVTITGGTVTATGGDSNGDGINFSGGALNREVIISGGNVTAKGGSNGKGIDISGSDGSSTTTFSTGDNGTAIIHVSSFGNSITKNEDSWKGIIFEPDTTTKQYQGKVYGDLTLDQNYTNIAGEVLDIPAGTTLTLGENVTLDNKGILRNYGAIDATKGTFTQNGALNNEGKIIRSDGVTAGPFLIKGGDHNTDYTYSVTDNKQVLTIKTSTQLTISTPSTDASNPVTNARIAVEGTGNDTNLSYVHANLILSGVNITAPSYSAISTGGDLSIKLQGSNTLTGGGDSGSSCGIYATGALTINGAGSLTAAGGTASDSTSYSAGIYSETSITIDGGEVTAIGGASNGTNGTSFGIYASSSASQINPTITITNGTVTATGGTAATTSCGMSANDAITINGGAVEATGGTATNNSYGIRSSSESISIKGGTGTASTNETSATNKCAMKTAPSFTNVGSKQANTAQSMSWGPVPNITAQPTAQTVTAGNTATFTVTAENATSYKWQVKKGEAEWEAVDGATNATLTITGTTTDMNGTKYQCVVDNDYGSATSDAVALTVNPAPVKTFVISATATTGGNVTGGGTYNENANVTLTATPNSGYEFVNWTENGTEVSASATYTFKATADRTLTANFRAVTPAHTHEWSDTWEHNETHHWHNCTATGCTITDNSAKNGYGVHTWDNGKVTTEPTYEADGEKTFTCTVCKATKTEPIEKLERPTPPSGGGSTGGTASPQPFVKEDTSIRGWSKISDTIENADKGDVINIDMNGAEILQSFILDDMAGKDITVTFDMGNVTWIIRGKDVPTGKHSYVDLSAKVGTKNIPSDLIGKEKAVQISLDHDGEFGFTATLSINLGKENADKFANLYYYDKSGKKLDFISQSEIDKNGKALLEFTHASDYAIVIGETEDITLGAGYEEVPAEPIKFEE